VEWVETTGRSVDEAKDQALDQLGVAEDEAEFEVVEEAKGGLFGRVRREARVRARVRPVEVRPKQTRKRGERKGRGSRAGSGGDKGRGKAKSQGKSGKPARSRAKADEDAVKDQDSTRDKPASADDTDQKTGAQTPPARSGGAKRSRTAGSKKPKKQPQKREPKMSDVTLKEHGEMVVEFVDGMIDAFGFEAKTDVVEVDEETLEVQVSGDDLGLLIGPKGQTLHAIQSLSRTIVQRRAEGRPEGRVRIDVGGYQERRSASLREFAVQLAADVVGTATEKGLEPMSASDRKVVHDALNDVDGVKTVSEGEDPRRHVVILPAD
jgi:spoIIIJ-associated protein